MEIHATKIATTVLNFSVDPRRFLLPTWDSLQRQPDSQLFPLESSAVERHKSGLRGHCGECCSGHFAAQVAICALIINVEFAWHIVWKAICKDGHTHPIKPASPPEVQIESARC